MDSSNEINIRTLRRTDPSVDCILSSATQVAVYNFVQGDWNKLEIEGALFVVSKSTNNYGLIIINRLNTNNFNEIIDKKWEVSLNLPFLLYKNDKGSIRCVWFYDQSDCKRVYDKLRELTTQPIENLTNANKNGLDLLKLTMGNNHSNGQAAPVEETLAKLGIKQSAKSNDTDQFMRSLIQQTNQKMIINDASEPVRSNQTPISIFNDKSIPNLPATPGTQARSVNLQELFNTTTTSGKPSVATNLTSSFLDKLVDENRIVADDRTPFKPRIDSINRDESELVLTPALLKLNGKPNNERQLSPPILSSTTVNPEQIYRPTPTTQFNNTEYVSPFHAKSTPALNAPNTLTMEQLKKTLIHLLQNDADFLHTIHTAYSQNVQNRFY